ncbi:translocation/assembly module TamB domain-containing protein [Pseudomonas typographi]|uniref:Translocation/assembly module TamB n=1 Tax=Pseudomonas typographi TaxID=2715964 RepID=A0ABR7ZA82_9PSED|nr:translocation/assembly module TamB [Pseudomonas typographi]
MTRAFKLATATLAGLLLLLALVLYGVLGTAPGGRWLLAQLPGLSVDGFEGHLGGQWQATRLHWQQGDHWLHAEQPRLVWSSGCLLRLALCVEQLQVASLDMDFSAGRASASSGPVQLPALALPVTVELAGVQVASLRYAGTEMASDLHLVGRWDAAGIDISALHARRDTLALDLAGSVQPEGAWPMAAEARLQLPAINGQPWQLALTAKGELQGEVALQGNSQGYLPATLQGSLAPLAEHLPARLEIDVEHFLAAPGLPPTLRLDGLHLAAQGDLQAGYAIDGHASLPAQQGDMALRLAGQVTAEGAQIGTLNLAGDADQRLALQGSLDWREGLAAEASLDWQQFPWRRLYPQAEAPPVVIDTLKAQASYRDGKYLGNLDAAFTGPAGAFTLVTPFSGDLREVFLPQLQLKAGQGEASGQLQVGFADGVSWKAALEVARLDPGYWLAQLPGHLGGTLNSQGQWRQGALGLTALLDVKGQLRGQPALLQANATGQGERWQLAALDLRLGANRIQGQGQLDGDLKGRLMLAMPHLEQLWPGLQGQANGQLDLAGSLDAPQGQLRLNGSQWRYQRAGIQTLNLRASLDSAQRGQLALAASGLHTAGTALGTLAVQGQGDRQRQALGLKLDGPQLWVDVGLDGTWANGAWKGRLARGQVRGGGQAWQLQAPAALQRLASGQIDFGAHCWRSGAASLCGENQRLAPQPRLRYHLKAFPLASLAAWLPPDFAWEGELNADVAVDLPASGPAGQVSVDAGAGTFRVRDGQQHWVDFPYRALRLDSRLTPRLVDSRLQLEGQQLGQLHVEAQIDPLAAEKPLAGQFQLEGLQLAVARPFLPMVDTLSGTLDGSGRLGGTLQAPMVTGQVRLSAGQVAGDALPVNLKNLQLTAAISGQQLQLDGGWSSGAQGSAQIGGHVDWARGLAVDLTLRGDHLPVTVEPYANLEVAPDLHLTLAGEQLAVAGKVLVPRGAITVRQLPPSTVKVSSDTQIVGQQAAQGHAATTVAMDVDVEVGQDTLTFDGFGLQAALAGHVHVGDNLDTRGELVLNDGRYRAYGQRLTLRRARLLFAGPIDQPYLDIEAIRQTDDVIAGIRLSGSVEQPSTEVFSEPAMSQEQALSYLVLGRPLSTTGEDNNMLAQAALGLGLIGTSGTAGELAKNLGIKDFQLDTEGSGDKTNVVASGNVSDRLTLRYGVGVFEPANTVALRYTLTKQLYVEVASGLASSLDLFYKRDF